MGRRRGDILDSIVGDLTAISALASVRRGPAMPSTNPSTQYPCAIVCYESEVWEKRQAPHLVRVEAEVYVDVFVRKGAKGDVFDALDALLEEIADALEDNQARVIDAQTRATSTTIQNVTFGESEDQTLMIARMKIAVVCHRSPGVE